MPLLALVRNFWNRLSALAWNSLTVAWGYALIVAGAFLDAMPIIADLINAPEMQNVINSYTGPYASHVLKIGGIITVLVRLRTINK